MYSRKVQNTFLQTTNLKNVKPENKIQNLRNYYFRYSFMIRKFTVQDARRSIKDIHNKMKIAIKKEAIYKFIYDTFAAIPHTYRNESSSLFKVYSRQLENIVAQRIRRTQQMFCLYSKLWEESAFREILRRFRHQFAKRNKDFLLAASGLTVFNWKEDRIKDDEIKEHVGDIDYIYKLARETFPCKKCQTKKIQKNKPNIRHCRCPGTERKMYDNWEAYIERKDITVWRRTRSDGIFEYKVYGSYKDVSAQEFIEVQIDNEYRKTWDATALVLEVIEKDPEHTMSEVLYWEMLWPRLFANRDYVLTRRTVVDKTTNTIIMFCRETTHPSRPPHPSKFRIQEYQSVTVIRPYKDMAKPGVEFCLTYFDNPGMSLPSSILSWVAKKALPEFLENLRGATKKYKEYCKKKGQSFPKFASYPTANVPEVVDLSVTRQFVDGEATESKDKDVPKSADKNPDTIIPDVPISREQTPGPEVMISPSPTIQADNETKGYLKYLHPYYYFS